MLPSLATPVAGAVQFVVGDHVYLAGGRQADGMVLQSLQRARLQADGTLGPVEALADPDLSIPVAEGAAVVRGSQVYVMGGTYGPADLSTVQSLDFADGGMGIFETGATTLISAARRHTAHIVGDHVYVLGGAASAGDGGFTHVASQRTTFNADGGPGAFVQDNAISFPARQLHASAFHPASGFLFSAGGIVDGVRTNTIHKARGTTGLAAFSQDTQALPVVLSASAALAFNSSLFLVGGDVTDGAPTGDTFVATLDVNGVLGQFAANGFRALRIPRAQHTVVTHQYSAHVLGGRGADGTPVARIEYAPTIQEAVLGPFGAVITTGFDPRTGHTTAVIGQWLYAFGGSTPEAFGGQTQRMWVGNGAAPDNAWELAGFTTRPGACIAIMGRWFFAIGGVSPEGLPVTSIARGQISDDGKIDTVMDDVADLFVDRTGAACVAIDASIIVLGGGAGAAVAPTGTIETVAVDLAAGSVTVTTQSVVLETPRMNHRAVIMGSRLFGLS